MRYCGALTKILNHRINLLADNPVAVPAAGNSMLMNKNLIRKLIIYGCFCVLTSCTSMSKQQQTPLQDASSSSTDQQQAAVPLAAPPAEPYFTREPATPVQQPQNSIRKGTGVFVNNTAGAAAKPAPGSEDSIADEGDITLNFEAADLREFVRVVFEDILKKNYLIDTEIKGKVTLHTTYPVADDDLLPIVESVLQQNGAAVVFQHDIFKVIPLADGPSQAGSPVVSR